MIHIEIEGKGLLMCGLILLAFLPQIYILFLCLTVEMVEFLTCIKNKRIY
jgi:hypothetical protein